MRRAVVTGGTSAIGLAIVRQLVRSGLEVTFTYRSAVEPARALAEQTGAHALQVDFLTSSWSLVLPEDTVILVNSAGVNLSGRPITDTGTDEVEDTLQVNLLAPMRLCKQVLPAMLRHEWGRIININSLWGVASAANRFSYAASKHALHALTTTLALETAAYGVTVNEICPGPVATGMLRQMGAQAIAQGRYSNHEEYLGSCAAAVPTGRLISAESIAATVGFLVSNTAADITGQSLIISGGVDL